MSAQSCYLVQKLRMKSTFMFEGLNLDIPYIIKGRELLGACLPIF